MLTGKIPFGQVCSLLLMGFGFAGYLHHAFWGVWVLLVGVFSFLLFLCLWVRLLLMSVNQAGQASLREHKVGVAIRLVLLWLLSFSSSFALIPLYYWLNSGGGHVHGAQASAGIDSTPLRVGEKVRVFFTQDVNTEKLDVQVSIDPKYIDLVPGESASLAITVHNASSQEQVFTLSAKPSPGESGAFIHYSLITDPVQLLIDGFASKRLNLQLHVEQGMPAVLGDVAIAHFVYGKAKPDGWRKMQAGWPNRP